MEALSALTLMTYPNKETASADGHDVSEMPDDLLQIRIIGKSSALETWSAAQVENYLRTQSRIVGELAKLAEIFRICPVEKFQQSIDLDGLSRTPMERRWTGSGYEAQYPCWESKHPDWGYDAHAPFTEEIQPF